MKPTCRRLELDLLDRRLPAVVPPSPRGGGGFPWRTWSLLLLLIVVMGCGTEADSPFSPPDKSGRVSGRVFDLSSGRELIGAFVSLDSGRQSIQTLSGQDGTFSFLALSPSSYRLTADAGGYNASFQNLDLQDRVHLTVDLGLRPSVATGSLAGFVVDSVTGARLGSAVVSIAAENYTTFTDVGGRFSAMGLDAGSLELEIQAVGYERFTARLEMVAGGTLLETFRLRANAGSLDGTVLSTNSVSAATPLAGALVKLLEPVGQQTPRSVTYAEFPTRTLSLVDTGIVTHTGADGRYRFSSVTVGTVGLLISAASHDDLLVTTTVALNRRTVRDARLRFNRATLAGRVLDQSGSPVGSALVSVAEQGLTTRTDAAGRYSFGSGVIVREFPLIVAIPGGTTTLPPHQTPVGCQATGFEPGSAWVTLTTGGSVTLDFVLRRATGTIVGTVVRLRGGVPIPGGLASLPQLGLTTPVGNAGLFSFSGLPTGLLRVEVDSVGYLRATTYASVLPGQSTQVRVGLAIPGALEGLVSKRSTQAAIVAARVLLPRLSRQMLTDGTGKYSFTELLPGTYEVQFSAQGQTSQTTTTTIVDGQTTRLDVLLDP